VSQGRQAKAAGGVRLERAQPHRAHGDAARKRAAVEMIAEHEAALKRTARRFSLDSEDAEDAYQRALEIVLTKAPTTDVRELIRWTQTVTKHEALAVRQGRERLLGQRRGAGHEEALEPIALLPATTDGPDEQVERREAIARSREALRALKPAERRALGLLAEGYSYAEIGALTGFSATKVNRVLAEGRDRFRRVIAGSEDGTRCRELGPLLSPFCDGEAADADAALVREHLRACASCRSTARAYRAAPRIVAGLAPLLPTGRSLLGRVRDLFENLGSRLPGLGGGEAAATQLAAAGGSHGAGIAALAKLLAICAGAAGGAACVATGTLPAPGALVPDRTRAPAIERVAPAVVKPEAEETRADEPGPAPAPEPRPPREEAEVTAPEPAPTEASAGAVEYEAPPPAPPSEGESAAQPSGSAAGEFGP
jgi:RNA polymerase sigma factor (sigma-70 family)